MLRTLTSRRLPGRATRAITNCSGTGHSRTLCSRACCRSPERPPRRRGRTTALVIAPTCVPGNCRLWAGSRRRHWRTDDALAADQGWTYLTRDRAELGRRADGRPERIRPATRSTWAPERRTGAAPAASLSAIYKSTAAGQLDETRRQLRQQRDVTRASLPIRTPSSVGSISKIVIDPANPNHIYVGSAPRPRPNARDRERRDDALPPNANNVGLYESTDGGATFTEVWNGTIDVPRDRRGPRPARRLDRLRVAFDQGLWRRSPRSTARRRRTTSTRCSRRGTREADRFARCSPRRCRTRRRAST